MKKGKAIAATLVLASFALLGTWAETVTNVQTTDRIGGFLQGAGLSQSCPYEDQTGGMGGQSGSCDFECGPGGISLSVSADDSGATVSGSGSCGGGSMHCRDQASCNSSDTAWTEGSGTCSGDSDEFYDSGLYVSCSGEAAGGYKDPGDVGEEPICPVGVEPSPPYPRVCVFPDADLAASPGGQLPLNACLIRVSVNMTLCEAPIPPREVVNRSVAASDRILRTFQGRPGVSAHIFIGEGMVSAIICWGFDCKQVLPTCIPAETETRMRCGIV
jgi:hypothetical protein